MPRGSTRVNFYVLGTPTALALGFALYVLIVIMDYLTTYELTLSPFYQFVILVVTWNCGLVWGLVFCMLSFGAPLIIGDFEGSPYSQQIYFYIDNANRLVSYLVALGLTAQLKAQHEHERDSARQDYLTGLANQKGFYEGFTIEIARHRREKKPLSIAYLDCDNFKDVNDRFGHKEGDRLLEIIARTLKANLRKTDLIGRLGGDEFAVVLSNTGKAHAIEAVDKLSAALNSAMSDRGWLVTFSVGLGIFQNVPESEDEMISFTDKLMYRVKSSGKNDILTDEYAGGGAVAELTAWRNTGS
jgi:diguanylate cyclase (GGDEF)-like protein